jgi:hypothetical protein
MGIATHASAGPYLNRNPSLGLPVYGKRTIGAVVKRF